MTHKELTDGELAEVVAYELSQFYGDIPAEHAEPIFELAIQEVLKDVYRREVRVKDLRVLMMTLYNEAIRQGDIQPPKETFPKEIFGE